MPSVQLDSDVAAWLEYVLHIMPKVPIELQLVWLYEIITKTYLQTHPEKFKKVKDYYVISIESLLHLISETFDELKALRKLYKFRNHYVHYSYYKIEKLWTECTHVQTTLNNIAQRYGVTLNWNKTVALDMM